MREFMDYIQSAFYSATGWNRDNSYSSLNATSDALLNFPTPRGLRLTLSSLATPQFATSYQLGNVGIVDGSISYLYSTVPLSNAIAQSEKIPLPDLLRSYRPLAELPQRARGLGGELIKDTVSYGRLYLPASMLEALVVRRVSPTLQLQLSAVSSETLRNGGTILGMAQYDEGRYAVEGLASTDGGLLGMRGLYNFGGDVGHLNTPVQLVATNGNGSGNGERERIYGRFSTGAELYYGTLNKSGGMSFGARFATLPTHNGTPLTATMTINPLMGNISWSYAVMAGSYCSLASRMDFNVYSYESDWVVGMELWRKRGSWSINEELEQIPAPAPVPTPVSATSDRSFKAKMEWRLDEPLPSPPLDTAEAVASPKEAIQNQPEKKKERSFQAKLEWRLDDPDVDPPPNEEDEEYSGVLKARLDQHLRVGLLWEGRVKSLLFSLGSSIDLRRLDSPFRTLGMEVQFSS
ncbi:mitochondrial inheritance component MDM10 [Annulohypoxylon maeteangense]|uniref:mitochondrial inheritance component MDM10 n=1 Tax=Annulohypoxylon maeteangense TaxID=1927788 RepID=UPI00200873EA|nr:mitochondrial inheritance component MDM10 [Annulohypoxylon maeteangense]KAI0887552.1 mitochondrial inheritance component MDM10 [Annulohypoxylon maeteangense]